MKKTILVVVLALVLTIAFASSAFATTGKFYAGGVDYYKWSNSTTEAVMAHNGLPGQPAPVGTALIKDGLSGVGANTSYPGVHANYLATTAKCGICHSVHRAAGGGKKLLPTSDATCSGCHTGSTAVTAKIITVTPINPNWVPSFETSGTGIVTNGAAAGGGGGPHNDSAADLYADGYITGLNNPVYPAPSFAHGERYGCFTRRCHATNPHGAGTSKYKIMAAKLLFNDTPAQDAANFPTNVGPFSYGGLDAQWDAFGASDAAVERFVSQNASVMSTTAAGDILIHGVAPNTAETHALVAGMTCGRPCTGDTGGYDECHAEAAYAIVDKAIKENRNHATGLTKAPSGTPGRTGEYTTDNTGEELDGWGGNDHRDLKTGHVAGSFDATSTHGSYAPIAGCTSCHDQTDEANTVAGHFTFPHGQTATGVTNLTTDGTTSATGSRSRIWMGYGAHVGDTLTYTAGTSQKAYDGQCLKCHRDATDLLGIGKTK